VRAVLADRFGQLTQMIAGLIADLARARGPTSALGLADHLLAIMEGHRPGQGRGDASVIRRQVELFGDHSPAPR
jgi:hypothetical protein